MEKSATGARLYGVVIALCAFTTIAQAQSGNGPVEPTATFQAQAGPMVQAVQAAPMSLAAPPPLTDQQKATLEYWEDRLPLPGPALASGGPSVAPPPGSETDPNAPRPQAPGSFATWVNANLQPVIPSGFSSSTNEPSTGMGGRNRFQTGNWYAAYSSNAGDSWTHLSPFTAFPSIDGGFCCDQDTLYEPSRDMFIWLLQYIKSGSGAGDTGGFRIAVYDNTRGVISGSGWHSYTFHPSQVGGPATGEWFDYPHLAVSSNFLYIAINVFTTTTDTWTRTVMIRLPLHQLRAGVAVPITYLSWTSNFNFTPVQGAKDVMYWASQLSGTTMTIFRWPDDSGSVSTFNRTVTAWTAGGLHLCPSSDGNDFCQRSDNRINAGALSRNALTKQQELWFFWNVRQDASFPYPYIDAAKFRESDLAYLSRPLLWSSNFAWHYIGASPNGRGDLGLSVAFGELPNRYPSSAVCLDDDYNGDPPTWECYTTRSGAHGPSSNRWGDYLRVRPAYPTTTYWTATAFTLQASAGTGNAEPRNMVFGRQRDAYDYFRWSRR